MFVCVEGIILLLLQISFFYSVEAFSGLAETHPHRGVMPPALLIFASLDSNLTQKLPHRNDQSCLTMYLSSYRPSQADTET